MALCEEIDYVVLYKERPLWSHGYILPFVMFYLSFAIGWLYTFNDDIYQHVELFFILLAAIGVLHVMTCLSCVWSVHVRCLLTCRRVLLRSATHVKVVPTPNNGHTQLVLLHREKGGDSEVTSFTFQNIRYINEGIGGAGGFKPIRFPVDHPLSSYISWKGYKDETDITTAKKTFGLNKLKIAPPDFWVLFSERATAPFFVFQVFCVGLWCLDEYWYYSLFTLAMLVLFETLLVQQQIRNLSEIQKMGAVPYITWVYRGGRWLRLSTAELLPGDLISFGRHSDDLLVPCDVLLLSGTCIVDESMLTGESVPQMKEPLSSRSTSSDDILNISTDGRLHVVYGGTKVVQHSSVKASPLSPVKQPPDQGCLGYVLRTGFNTSQGKLLRTILFGVKRVTANNLETFMFILFLLVFAIIASAYVWTKGTENPDRNRYKLFLECTLILTSVVPPELPIELSLAVNNSLLSLTKIGVYCTEPFRIPFAGKVDICCFDKTGTLTSDNLIVQGIAGIKDSPLSTQCVLASCHSLSLLDNELVGDPLEKAAIQSIGWKLSRNDTVSSSRGQKCSLSILHRFHFSSSLKRMSVVVHMTTPTDSYISCVKGAPEVIKTMLREIPRDYDDIYSQLSYNGARVLALGHRDIGRLSMKEAGLLKRHEVERDLDFDGFIAITCPLKKHTKECIDELKGSSHHVVMITGDNPLTAGHIARELAITCNDILMIEREGIEDEMTWVDQKKSIRIPFTLDMKANRQLLQQYDLCITGKDIDMMVALSGNDSTLKHILPYVRVFARVSPKQKELVINCLKSCGYYTLMCGDGTNDVGALKHAHVGVSLLSTVHVKKSPAPSEEQLTRQPLRPKRPAPIKDTPTGSNKAPPRNKLLQDFLKKTDEGLKDPSLVRLGDASIASPFTSRETNIKCICHVIKQGRCTLVTTLQMFKILALNALILAYSQSVLYLDGIKFSDTQATIQGILLAGCFLFISRSKPLNSLSQCRPLINIFNIYTLLTVFLQFCVHFSCLVYLVRESKQLSPPTEEGEFIDLEKEFEKNIVNSAVYIISMTMQISNFAVNYKGHPFMVSLTDNKPLFYSLLVTSAVILSLAAGVVSDFSQWLEIVEFPNEFQIKLLAVLAVDFIATFVIDRILFYFLGTSKLRKL